VRQGSLPTAPSPRDPSLSLVEEHYERFEQVYPERYEDRYSFFRPVIRETVYKYLVCGDLKRGFARVRQGVERMPLGPIPLSDDTACAKAARGTWARFLKKVGACPEERQRRGTADPLVCPDCGGPMPIVAFIEEPRVVRAILEHLSLWGAPRPRAPPVAAGGPVDFEYVPCQD